MSFTLYPAIDLRHGKVVRLEHGDPDRQTVFGDDPAGTARRWIAAGAGWLHVVNLDGAFDEGGRANWQALQQLVKLEARVQFGGGIRSLKDVAHAINTGVSRVVLGTVAIEAPDIVESAVRHFGAERVAVGIDARDGRVKTRGWQQETEISPVDLAQQMGALGVQTVIYTDISRDGVLTGPDVAATGLLARDTGLDVIASGGVAGIDDVRQLAHLYPLGVSGVIVGRALYENKIDLAAALRELQEAPRS